jgi:hypothetical protein
VAKKREPEKEITPQETPGGQGGNVQSFEAGSGQTSDTRLIGRAIRDEWPIPEDKRAALIERQIEIGLDPLSSKREATMAFRSVVFADKLNFERDKRDNPTPQLVQHHHTGSVNLVAIRQEVLSEPGFLEYLRSRSAEADGDSGGVCQDGEPRTLEAGPASTPPGPGDNGADRTEA